jgi:peptide/nickel transport system ATP-binding protein
MDVTIQAQILDLMRELRQTFGTAMVLITHDMGVVAENADRVVVMYAGRKVEEAAVDDLFDRPAHPYTHGLLGSIPNLDVSSRANRANARLNEIKGMVPVMSRLPAGCAFAPRCGYATDRCRTDRPVLRPLGDEHNVRQLGDEPTVRRPLGDGHVVACWHAEQVMGAPS